MLALLLAALGVGGALQDTATARAESLLAVGRAQFARPVIGRYPPWTPSAPPPAWPPPIPSRCTGR